MVMALVCGGARCLEIAQRPGASLVRGVLENKSLDVIGNTPDHMNISEVVDSSSVTLECVLLAAALPPGTRNDPRQRTENCGLSGGRQKAQEPPWRAVRRLLVRPAMSCAERTS